MKKFLSIFLAVMLVVMGAFALTGCKKGNSEPKVKVIDIKLTDENYAFAVSKDNTALKEDFNAFLTTIKNDGRFDAIIAKYFENVGTKVGYPITSESVSNTASNFVVATNTPFSPFEYTESDGKVYGADMEIAGLYAQERDLTLIIKDIPFESILEDVKNGYSDIGMAGMTNSAERLESVDFTDEYYQASQKLIVAYNNKDFDNCTTVAEVEAVLSGLTGKTIGFQTGTTGGLYIEGNAEWGFTGFSNVTSRGYSTAQLAAMDLANGNIYAVCVDEGPAAAIVAGING